MPKVQSGYSLGKRRVIQDDAGTKRSGSTRANPSMKDQRDLIRAAHIKVIIVNLTDAQAALTVILPFFA